MTLRQIFIVLRLRWWLIVGMLALTGLLAGLYLWKAKWTYVAKTSIIVDLRVDPLLSQLAPALGAAGHLATQVEILQSDRLA